MNCACLQYKFFESNSTGKDSKRDKIKKEKHKKKKKGGSDDDDSDKDILPK